MSMNERKRRLLSAVEIWIASLVKGTIQCTPKLSRRKLNMAVLSLGFDRRVLESMAILESRCAELVGSDDERRRALRRVL